MPYSTQFEHSEIFFSFFGNRIWQLFLQSIKYCISFSFCSFWPFDSRLSGGDSSFDLGKTWPLHSFCSACEFFSV